MNQISILIADDHAIVRRGLAALLNTEPDLHVLGAAENGEQAVAMAEKLKPDVVIMDLAMPILNGIEATKRIRRSLPQTKIVGLSSYSDDEPVISALQAGASGFVTKSNAAEDLVECIRAVRRGLFISPEILRQLRRSGYDPLAPRTPPTRSKNLSNREAQVLQAVADGLPNKQIADQLGISIKTVEKHRQRLMNKLDLHETAGLTRYALAHRIVDANPQPA